MMRDDVAINSYHTNLESQSQILQERRHSKATHSRTGVPQRQNTWLVKDNLLESLQLRQIRDFRSSKHQYVQNVCVCNNMKNSYFTSISTSCRLSPSHATWSLSTPTSIPTLPSPLSLITTRKEIDREYSLAPVYLQFPTACGTRAKTLQLWSRSRLNPHVQLTTRVCTTIIRKHAPKKRQHHVLQALIFLYLLLNYSVTLPSLSSIWPFC